MNRASEHQQNTAQRFNDENALMAACFYTLEEDVVEHEQRAARMFLRRYVPILSNCIAVTNE